MNSLETSWVDPKKKTRGTWKFHGNHGSQHDFPYMIYMNRKDRMIEHGHFFKDRYKFHVMPSPGYHWTLEVSRVCGWWAWQDFSQHDAPRSFCNWAKNTKNALLLNSKFWKQSGRLVHEQVVLDKFGKLDVAAPLTWKSDKYFFKVLSDISLYLVQSSSFFICFQERKAPRRFMRTRLKSLLQKRQDGATHKDLAVFFGPKIGSAIGVVLDTKSLRWCRWSRFFSFRAFRMVLLQFLVSQPAFFFFRRSECFADARSCGTLRKSWRVCIQRANHTSPSAFAGEGGGFAWKW